MPLKIPWARRNESVTAPPLSAKTRTFSGSPPCPFTCRGPGENEQTPFQSMVKEVNWYKIGMLLAEPCLSDRSKEKTDIQLTEARYRKFIRARRSESSSKRKSDNTRHEKVLTTKWPKFTCSGNRTRPNSRDSKVYCKVIVSRKKSKSLSSWLRPVISWAVNFYQLPNFLIAAAGTWLHWI